MSTTTGFRFHHARRLMLLAKHLRDNVKNEHFDMSKWRSDCGTYGCALGHAVHIPSFKRLGLHCRLFESPTIGCKEGLEAGAYLFGLRRSNYSDADEPWQLFSSEENYKISRWNYIKKLVNFTKNKCKANNINFDKVKVSVNY